MTREPAAEPLTWNVAGLLAEDPGAERDHDVAGAVVELEDDLELAEAVAGRVRLRRTNRGILAEAGLTATLAAACARCLRPVRIPVDIRIDEEFLPALELSTGRPLPTDDEPDVARLTDHHELELGPLVRDELLLAEPIAPVCRPDCPGLCAVCGLPLDEGVHEHEIDDIDPRLEALRAFRVNEGE